MLMRAFREQRLLLDHEGAMQYSVHSDDFTTASSSVWSLT